MKKVPTMEVKRAFVVSNFVKTPKGRKRYLDNLSLKDFKKRLLVAKRRVLHMTEKELDKHISPDWPKRLRAYNNSQWYISNFKTTELGVWKRAGGLPLVWTRGSLAETGQNIKVALKNNPKLLTARARRTIPSMLNSNVKYLQKEKYLLPIVFKAGTGTNGRKGLKKKLKGDIDDGCMRSIAFAVNGVKTVKVYFGIPKMSALK